MTDFIIIIIIITYVSLNFAGVLQHSFDDFQTIFYDITQREGGLYTSNTMDDFFYEVWMPFLVKNWPILYPIGQKYNQECIWDGIVYHLINFRKEFTNFLEP